MTRTTRWVAGLAAVALAAPTASACGAGGGSDDAASSPVPREEITVLAAASLTDVFAEIGDSFSRAHPGSQVRFTFGPSSGLATQIGEGAPGDVFAPADEAAMGKVVDAGAVAGQVLVFARNAMEIAVPPGNPGGIAGLEDLARPELFVGLCAEEVPCGRLGHQVLERAGVAAAPDTNETDVRSLLTKVEAGELDAGLVYRSDVVAAAGKVEGIDLPTSAGGDILASYPIAVLAGSADPDLARAFVDHVVSPEGQRILAAASFLPS